MATFQRSIRRHFNSSKIQRNHPNDFLSQLLKNVKENLETDEGKICNTCQLLKSRENGKAFKYWVFKTLFSSDSDASTSSEKLLKAISTLKCTRFLQTPFKDCQKTKNSYCLLVLSRYPFCQRLEYMGKVSKK